jgi:hypothetical protein
MFNPEASRLQFCGIHIDLNRLGWKKNVIFHPMIFGQLRRQVVYHIQLKNYFGRSFFFCKIEFCQKNGWPYSVFFFF